MAERSKTGYLPLWPINRKLKTGMVPGGTKHDSHLDELMGVRHGVEALREEFLKAKGDINARFEEGDLGPVGRTRALKALEKEFNAKLEEYRPRVEGARKHSAELLRDLTTRPRSEESKSADEAVEKAFARHRTIQRFESLSSGDRLKALRIATEKRDARFLRALLDEGGLIDDRTARLIESELMRDGDRDKFHQLEELEGTVIPGSHERDPLTGALPVVDYALASTSEWLKQETEQESTLKERLDQQVAEKLAARGDNGSNGGTEGA